jgi:hypothetical protein
MSIIYIRHFPKGTPEILEVSLSVIANNKPDHRMLKLNIICRCACENVSGGG